MDFDDLSPKELAEYEEWLDNFILENNCKLRN